MDPAALALDWLAKNASHELSFNPWDDDPEWQVHRVVGNRNDREWHLIATGETPLAALQAAMTAGKRKPRA